MARVQNRQSNRVRDQMSRIHSFAPDEQLVQQQFECVGWGEVAPVAGGLPVQGRRWQGRKTDAIRIYNDARASMMIR